MRTVLFLIASVLIIGCSKSKPPPPQAYDTKMDRAARTAVYTALQYDNIQLGKRAGEKIKKAGSDHASDLEEVGVETK